MDRLAESAVRTLEQGHCPACGGRGFVIGPQGGMAINVECANVACRERFNVSYYGGRVVFAERIGNGKVDIPWPTTGGPA